MTARPAPTVLVLCICSLLSTAYSADLTIAGVTGETYEGGAYDRLTITNSSGITVRNCTFAVSSGYVVEVGSGCSDITLEGCDVNGLDEACTGIQMSGVSNVTVRNCDFHDIADDGVSVHGGTNVTFEGNTIRRLLGCGTDGGCGPCYNGHSDGFEVSDIDGGTFVGNLVYDVRSTSAFFMGNWGAPNCRDLVLANNIFYTPESGFVIYVHYVDGFQIYNNTFWQGVYGGLAIGAEVTGLDVYNNILHSVNYNHSKTAYVPSEHHFDYNLVATTSQGLPAQTHDVVDNDPGFTGVPAIGGGALREVTAEDFSLSAGSPCIGKGVSGGDVPATDFFGSTRTGDVDLGAVGYGLAATAAGRGSTIQKSGVSGPALTIAALDGAAGASAPSGRLHDMRGRRVTAHTVRSCGILIAGPH